MATLPVFLSLVVVSVACGRSDPPSQPEPPPAPPVTPIETTPAPPSAPPAGLLVAPASCAAQTPRPQRPESEAGRVLEALDGDSPEAELRAALARVDALLARDADDADAHFARGVLLGATGASPEAQLEAYQRAYEIDDTHLDAAYNAGTNRAQARQHAAALEWFERAVAIDPTQADVQYNIGQAAYDLRRFDRSLEGFLCAREHTPEPFEETKKVVQALHALGRFADAIPMRQEMWRIQAASSRFADVDEVVIDQMEIEGRKVMITETRPPAVEPDLRYIYIARAYDGTRVIHSVQLETSNATRANGGGAILGTNDGAGHRLLGGFEEMPTYETARGRLTALLGRAIRGER